MDGLGIIVGVPVSESPEAPVPSVQRACRECGQDTWVSVGGSGILLQAGAEVICLTCYNKAIEGEDTVNIELPPAVIREMNDWSQKNLGVPFTRETAERIIRAEYKNPHIRVTVMGDTVDEGVNTNDQEA